MKNFLERVIVRLPEGRETIIDNDVDEELNKVYVKDQKDDSYLIMLPLKSTMKDVEQLAKCAAIIESFKRKNGNRDAVCRELDISEGAFYNVLNSGAKIAHAYSKEDSNKTMTMLSCGDNEKAKKLIRDSIRRFEASANQDNYK